ncbi:LysR substrate-binding domain-containing protein [Stigmatella sp. ncwal1]|uniref:LysR substrate-binding domain-containing protein n=1 Tax=Stigmatella ashevillensis TaxID=2995309 RepID=A0ABT5DCY7_9BACT|nr:LysR substrate-binding domain-containing protein [Stigmatella ashevillena]MDC0710990.1 LysR substrate-binding domain-containing protein [Stigmatella ashevillena]
MQDLNDLFFFAEVVAHGGFAPAGRALRQPKSKLSRRVAQLEEQLGVRLIERSSRRFRVTDVGQAFYEHCQNVMAEVKRAEAAVAATQGEPHGTVRFSCPLGMMEPLAGILSQFMKRYPQVNLQVVATNRRVDLITERVDVALRVRTALDTDATLTVRTLARSRRILVASPDWARHLGGAKDLEALGSVPTLSSTEQSGQDVWELIGPEQRTAAVRHEPRLACGDFLALREAAIAGLGVSLLPGHSCGAALRSGQLVHVFPDWHAPDGMVHLVFTSRRGLPLPVGALIDHLAEHVRDPLLLASQG